MKRLIHISFSLVLIGLLAFPAESLAQDASKEDARTVIEIKDGKVYMNGEEIAELEDSDSSVLFKRSGDGEVENVWIAGDDFFKQREAFERARRGDGNAFRVRSSPRAFGFMSRDGRNAEYFEHEAIEDALAAGERVQRQYAEVIAGNLAENALEIESLAPGISYFARSNALSEEGREADRRSREIARMLRNDEGNADELEAELDELLGKVFDEKQAAQQERIDEMRQKLMELEERLDQRQTDRSDIIAKRKNELLGRSSRYDW
jgi:hypothetical protein